MHILMGQNYEVCKRLIQDQFNKSTGFYHAYIFFHFFFQRNLTSPIIITEVGKMHILMGQN